MRNPDGSPAPNNPTLTIAPAGAAPIGVPNFIIDRFSIPPFLLPIYQACGTQYGIPWQVLAGINRIETAFGTNLNVSTAGARGWMQFIPSTWDMYGVDANNDRRKDPYNPVDAICAAARYLKAAGGQEDLRGAIFAYNHADWYVDEVLLYARQYGKLPSGLIGSLTGLTEGARFPVAADARYADDISERKAAKDSESAGGTGNVAQTINSSPTRRGINIYSRERAPVIAVNDGTIKEIGHSDERGNYVVLVDTYGNRFTYAELGRIEKVYPVPKEKRKNVAVEDTDKGSGDKAAQKAYERRLENAPTSMPKKDRRHVSPPNTEDARPRVYALPDRQPKANPDEVSARLQSIRENAFEIYKRKNDGGILKFNPKKMQLAELEEGSKVIAGTVLGRLAEDDKRQAPHLNFSIRPTGKGAPKIDPKPILDGWKLLEATAIYRAAGESPFANPGATASDVLLMSKEELERRVLADPNLEIYACGRNDIQTGQIDRRVLAVLAYLSASGLRLGITSLKCGHSTFTTSGNVSNHSHGGAVDIAVINGIPVLGHQGPGSITDTLLHEVLDLQGTMVPAELISLEDLGGPSFSLPDHDDHVHIGYSAGPDTPTGAKATEFSVLRPRQWRKLVRRLGEIDNPEVRTSPSNASTPAREKEGPRRASQAHKGE
jgi:hypothetical protein